MGFYVDIAELQKAQRGLYEDGRNCSESVRYR